jgi:uncharacterized protein (DUF1501 family)
MNPTRREFFRAGAAAGSMISLGWSVPLFLSRAAFAAPMAGKPGARDTILVVIELTGGNDGLNTVVPYADAEYGKLRSALRLPQDQLKKLNDSIALHPSMGGLAGLLEDHALCVVQGVGYPNPSQSHFRSMDIWQAASTAKTLTEGWLGKALKGMPAKPSFHLADANETAPLALAGAPTRVPSITSLEDFQLRTTAANRADNMAQRALIEGAARPQETRHGMLDFVQRTASNTYASSRRLQELATKYQPKVPYPNSGLGSRLQLAAQLIDGGLGARIFYVAIGNFDTHAGQLPTHANLLRDLSDAMTAFYKDMKARGHQDRVLMMTFSEFGRRAKENGSRGTDHGSAAPLFLVGGRVKAGAVGAHPSLTDLEFGNLKHHIDFRQVYAAVLDGWLGVSSKEVLGQTFQPVPILAT